MIWSWLLINGNRETISFLPRHKIFMKWWKQCSVDLEMQCFWPFGHSQLPAVCVWHLINVPQVGLLNTQAIMYGAAVIKGVQCFFNFSFSHSCITIYQPIGSGCSKIF